MILKVFDVGCGMWHFAAAFQSISDSTQNGPHSGMCFGVCRHGANIHRLLHFVCECRLIGSEEPFIAHSAEQCPSIWKGISYQRPAGSHYRVLFHSMAYPKLLCICQTRNIRSRQKRHSEGWLRISCSWQFHLSWKLHYIKNPLFIYFP